MATNNTIFNGNSRFATDFQAIIDRSVAIASLSLDQLKNVKGTLSSQSSALNDLNTKFSSLQTAISSLETATGTSSYSSSVSNGAILMATVGSSINSAGTYTIEVTSLGSYTNGMSKAGLNTVTDPSVQNIRAATNFTLTVNGVNTTITPSGGTLNDLVTAINQAGVNVEASVANVGTSSSPDYRLSLRSTKLGGVTLDLKDGATPLLDTLATGALAGYKLNGMAAPLTSDSRTITLAPGLTVTFLQQSALGDATTVSVTRGATGVSNALSSFVTAYNAAVDELDKHRGENKGALTGDSIIGQLSATLRELTSYSTSTGSIRNLTGLGLNFDKNGKLSLDASTFSSATTGNIQDLMSFLGASASGGFLKTASDALNGVEDATSGVLQDAITSIGSAITDQNTRIDDEQARVDALKESLQTQMGQADALIASLEQQATYVSGLFESMRIASQNTK